MNKVDELYFADYIINQTIEMINFLSGYKTYFMGALAIAWAVVGYLLGNLDGATAQTYAWAGFTAIFLRAGVSGK